MLKTVGDKANALKQTGSSRYELYNEIQEKTVNPDLIQHTEGDENEAV